MKEIFITLKKANYLTAGEDLPAERVDPVDWSLAKKWTTIVTACTVSFVVSINATAVLSAVKEISLEFDIETEPFDYSYFLVTAWNTGAAIFPLFILPVMEDFGIRPLYLTLYAVFTLFVVVQAVAPNYTTMLVSRVIAGSCGGVLQSAADGMTSDIWGGQDVRRQGLSITLVYFALLGGLTIGPVIGAAVIKTMTWRWIFYIELMIYGAMAVPVAFCLHDTRASSRSEKEPVRFSQVVHSLKGTIGRACHMLLTDFTVASFTLWSAFAFGTVLVLTQSIPIVYAALYDWSEWQTGVIQIAVFIGELIGFLLCIFQDFVIFPRYSRPRAGAQDSEDDRGQSQDQEVNIEARLYTAIPGALLGLTAGFFIYGWTSNPTDGYPWPLPTLGLLLMGVGILLIGQSCTNYITDCYPTQANSAISAVAFGENIFAAFLPLATLSMYQTLGFSWASTLLGFIGLLLSGAPVILVFYGSRLRARRQH